MVLTHNVGRPLERGTVVLLANITSGAVSLQISVDGSTYITLDGESFTATTTKYLHLPKCTIRALITGTAEVVLARVDYT